MSSLRDWGNCSSLAGLAIVEVSDEPGKENPTPPKHQRDERPSIHFA